MTKCTPTGAASLLSSSLKGKLVFFGKTEFAQRSKPRFALTLKPGLSARSVREGESWENSAEHHYNFKGRTTHLILITHPLDTLNCCTHFTVLRAAGTLTPDLPVAHIVLRVATAHSAHLLPANDLPSLLLEPYTLHSANTWQDTNC